jgi:hypothetical protein
MITTGWGRLHGNRHGRRRMANGKDGKWQTGMADERWRMAKNTDGKDRHVSSVMLDSRGLFSGEAASASGPLQSGLDAR